jgi:RNA polymerase-binding transcription factor DksA
VLTKDSIARSFAHIEFARIRHAHNQGFNMDEIDQANDLAETLRNAAIMRSQREVSAVNKTGICAECDEVIDPERLAVAPFARHCISCATDLARKAKTHRSFS